MRSNITNNVSLNETRRRPSNKFATNPLRKTALQERLKTIVLMELHEDGGMEYHTMTLRGLYDYVIRAITNTKRSRLQDGKEASSSDIGASQTNTSSTSIPSSASTSTWRIRQPSIGSMEDLPPPPVRPGGDLLSSISENHHSTETRRARSGTFGDASERSKSVRSILTAENEQEQHVVTIRERLGGYLHPRDMRRLVTPISASNEPELMVRRHVMLLNFDPLRAIVLRDRLLVLVPDGADSILISLEKRVRGGIDEMEKQVFGEGVSENSMPEDTIVDGLDILEKDQSEIRKPLIELKHEDGDKEKEDEGMIKEDQDLSMDTESRKEDESGISMDKEWKEEGDGTNAAEYDIDNEWEEFEGGSWIKMSYELQSVDAVLSSVVKMLSDESLDLRKKIFDVMEEMRGDSSTAVPGDHVQEQLRILKDKVREMEGRVQGFVRAINQILDDEEDMSLMNLSRLITHPDRFIQPVPQQILDEESDEPELILEVYLQQALSEVNALDLLKGNILNTEELVSLQMDTVRNRLLYINTVVSVISLTVACASLVGSIFGMNLTNHMENDPHTFIKVVSGTLIGTMIMLITVLVLISKTGVMPANPRKVLYSKRRVDIDART